MSRKAKLPQSRRHIFVYDEDWKFIQQAYGVGTGSRLGVSGAIREIIHAKVVVLRAKIQERYDEIHRSAGGGGNPLAAEKEIEL